MTKRASCVLLAAKGQGATIINAIPQLEFWNTKANDCPSFQNELRWTFPNGSRLRMYLIRLAGGISLPQLSTAADNTWTAYLLMPKVYEDENGIPSRPFNVGTRVFRYLKRITKSAANTNAQGEQYLLGPWSPKHIAEIRPAFANQYLKEQVATAWDGDGVPTAWGPKPGAPISLPIVVAGEDPVAQAVPDYRPTDQEVDDDTEADEDTLFPVAAE